MITAENISIVLQIATFIGIVFAVYLYFKKPQITSELNDAIFTEQFKNLTDKFDDRFQDMKEGVIKLMQNDLHELKSDVREHIKNQIINERSVASDFTKIFTLLDERLPRK